MQAALPHQDAGDELHSKDDAADDLDLLDLRRLLEPGQRAEAERDRRAEMSIMIATKSTKAQLDEYGSLSRFDAHVPEWVEP